MSSGPESNLPNFQQSPAGQPSETTQLPVISQQNNTSFSVRSYIGDRITTTQDKLKSMRDSIASDYTESDHKALTVAAGIGTIAVQAFDRARFAVIIVPTVAADVLQSSHSPVEAALAGGATFAGWCALVGASTIEGLQKYPNSTDRFGKEFPGLVSVFEDALPGFEKPKPTSNIAKRIGKRVLTGAQRGIAAVGIGTTAYVSTASAQGKKRKDIHELNLNVSADGGALVGGVVFGVSETIVHLANSHPLLAERIQNDATNTRNYVYAAGALMAAQFVGTKIKSFRNKHKPSDSGASPNPDEKI